MTIRTMTIEDYPAVYALWASLPGIGLHEREDSLEGMAYYLKRNPDSCFIAKAGNEIIGAVLCGNDGRRGYINHLAVAQGHRGKGLGRALVNKCLMAMRSEGICKCNLVTYRSNDDGNAFWDAMHATRREDALYRSIETGEIS